MRTQDQSRPSIHALCAWAAALTIATTASMALGSDSADGVSESPPTAPATDEHDEACVKFCWQFYTYPSHFICAYAGGSCASKTCQCECGFWGAFRKHTVGPGSCQKGV